MPTTENEILDNDNISRGFDALDLIPDELRGSPNFVDVVSWNIRYFHDRDPERLKLITEILSVLNADVIVLQEILYGSLDPVAESLRESGAGYYDIAYGTTGGQQRVALMWDLDYIRAKEDTKELVKKKEVIASDGKDAFPRLPLWGYFSANNYNWNQEGVIPFDFQLVGLHLKSQRGGGAAQRKRAGDWLADWLHRSVNDVDTDVIMAGDWNEPPSAEAWNSIRQLEASGEALFSSVNNSAEISHLYYKNKQNLGSRLDLKAISIAAYDQVYADPKVVNWAPMEKFLEATPKAQEIKDYFKEISKNVSDHMPVITRFHFAESD